MQVPVGKASAPILGGKLLLTSDGFESPELGQVFLEIAGKPASELTVLFVPTAAVTPEQRHNAQLSRAELHDLGIRAQNLRVLELNRPVSPDEAVGKDLIYVCGGDTLHLLTQARAVGFDRLLAAHLSRGGLYVGVSAGSILVGPVVRGQAGLGLVDCVILPHYHQGMEARLAELQASWGQAVLPLADGRAVLIVDGQLSLVP